MGFSLETKGEIAFAPPGAGIGLFAEPGKSGELVVPDTYTLPLPSTAMLEGWSTPLPPNSAAHRSWEPVGSNSITMTSRLPSDRAPDVALKVDLPRYAVTYAWPPASTARG